MSDTKRTLSSSLRKVTCSRHDVDEWLVTWQRRGTGSEREGASFTGEPESGGRALWEHLKVGYKFSKTDKKGYVALRHTFIPLGKLKWPYFAYILETLLFLNSFQTKWGGVGVRGCQKIIYFLLDVKTIWLGGKAYPHFP